MTKDTVVDRTSRMCEEQRSAERWHKADVESLEQAKWGRAHTWGSVRTRQGSAGLGWSGYDSLRVAGRGGC